MKNASCNNRILYKGMIRKVKFVRESNKINIETINSGCLMNPEQLVKSSEDYYDHQLDMAADQIIASQTKTIFLTGPSASGKTTTAKMLVERLEERGKKGTRISLDNFYKNIEQIPLWEDGSKNFEIIDSLDIDYLRSLFKELNSNHHANFPIFDFVQGKRLEKTFPVTLDGESFIVLEGIHALNPQLTASVGNNNCMKIYVSPHSVFSNDKDEIILGTQELRLTRRIIRDKSTRGASAKRTIDMWDDVLRGEFKYIRPYRSYADIHINSTHAYEPLLYKEELVSAVAGCYDSIDKEIRDKLLRGLDKFNKLDKSYIPKNSLITEFMPSILNKTD